MDLDENSLNSMPTVAGGARPLPAEPYDEPSLGSAPTMRGQGVPGAALGQIDQYQLVRKLGGGGFGVVYLARDTVSGIDVALKTLHPLLKSNPEEMEALRSKFALVSRLTHQNIAKALVLHPVRDIAIANDEVRRELHLSPGDFVMVMRYAPGVTLSKWRKQFPDGIVPPDQALEIVRQVASALDYAHGEKIVHRDIKPANIMVETLGGGESHTEPQRHREGVERIRVRILDFGLAAEIRSSMSRISTETGDTSGTRPYMAPEQWLGRKQDGRTDQYALACVLYELLAGAPPFAGVFETGDPVIMRTAIERDAPEEIEGIPAHVNAALQKALAKNLKERFGSCVEFVEACTKPQRIFRQGGQETPSPDDVAKNPAKPLASSALPWLLVGIAFLITGFVVRQKRTVEAPKGQSVSIKPKDSSVLELPTESNNASLVKNTTKTIDLGNGVSLEMVLCESIAPKFWIGKYEVTQEQWQHIMGNNPSRYKGDSKPVEEVSFYDCLKFISKLNANPYVQKSGLEFRLPEYMEWLNACYSGEEVTSSHYGRLEDGSIVTNGAPLSEIDRFAWFQHDREKAYAVGTSVVGGGRVANAWGLYDMWGNVEEWTQTLTYKKDMCLVAGDDFYSKPSPVSVYAHHIPKYSSYSIGFRLAATATGAISW
jgi:serine/threonine-protein kinase